MNRYIYVDNSSTTRLNENVLYKMLPYLKENYGNASTTYSLGKISSKAIDDSRKKIAKCINANPDEIYFTASGTEADNMAIQGIAHKYMYKGKHIITSSIEHLAVLNTCKKLEQEGFEVTYIEPQKNGIIDVGKIKEAIREDTILISIMYVNNEIGTIQNIDEISSLAKEKGIIFHTDAVQAMPHLKVDVKNIDALTMSAHKFNGPKGVGALYLRSGISIENVICGGHQEKGIRPGTENVAGIVGMAEALDITVKNLTKYNKKEKMLRDYLYNILNSEIEGVIINGDKQNRISSNLNISINGVDSSELMIFLDMNGICASGGSACNSSQKELSHVLKAIGQGNTALRITLSSENTIYDMDKIAYVLKRSVNIIRSKKNN